MDKLKRELQSRRFWAMVTTLTGIWCAAYTKTVTPIEAVILCVAALSTYSIATGIQTAGQGQ